MIQKIHIVVFALILCSIKGVSANEEDLQGVSISYDYSLMKEQTFLMAKNIGTTFVSDSVFSFKNKEGYDFNIKLLVYEIGAHKTHKLIVDVLPPRNVSYSGVDIFSLFNAVSSEVLKFHDYILIDEVGALCEMMKEKMKKSFDLLGKNVKLKEPYYDSCFALFREENLCMLSLEACNNDFPNESLEFSCPVVGKCRFLYSFTLP